MLQPAPKKRPEPEPNPASGWWGLAAIVLIAVGALGSLWLDDWRWIVTGAVVGLGAAIGATLADNARRRQ